jgi:hypothetical protein
MIRVPRATKLPPRTYTPKYDTGTLLPVMMLLSGAAPKAVSAYTPIPEAYRDLIVKLRTMLLSELPSNAMATPFDAVFSIASWVGPDVATPSNVM